MRGVACTLSALVVLSAAAGAQDGRAASGGKAAIRFADVQPLWSVLRQHAPAPLSAMSIAELESAWPAWVRAQDANIRARVTRGDEDSLVNLWLFGTSFTDRPPARPRDIEVRGSGASLSNVANGRLEDLIRALASPGTNARLHWAAQMLREKGIDARTSAGEVRAREFVAAAWKRMLTETTEYGRTLDAPNEAADPFAFMAPYASLYSDRGLSSDTSILSSFAVDATLGTMKESRLIGATPIRRVAVVGPGLDFINKADGHDFYPEQTIQPFALIDSLFRLGLSRPGDLSVTTFDVSARVNQHLAAARDRARAGNGYVVQLPISDAEEWSTELLRYWERAGGGIGEVVPASPAPRSAGNVKARAIRVQPDVVLSVSPIDLNIIVERLEPLADDHRFDLIVATNVFVYYEVFQQALAMVNLGRMLRAGGSLLVNQAVRPVAPMRPAVGHNAVVYSGRQFDHLFLYQTQ